MSDVLHRADKRYLRSVNTPDYDVADWIINPDLAAVVAQPVKYWEITGDVVSLADGPTQAAIDAALAAAADTASKAGEKTRLDVEKVLKGIVQGVVGEINRLREEHRCSNRTCDQVRTAIRTNVDNL